MAYFRTSTPSAPVTTEGYFVKAESKVLMGTSALYGSLDVSSTAYSTYTISVGLESGQSVELGFLESIGFSYVPSWEAVDSANVAQGTVYDMTSEELTLSVGLREFKYQALEAAINSGVMYTSNNEVLFAFGGGCNLVNRPIAIEFTNQACNIPDSADITAGVTGGVLTAYDCICTSGLPWDAIVRNELNLLSLEFKGRPVLARTKGQRFGLDESGPFGQECPKQTKNNGEHPTDKGNPVAYHARETDNWHPDRMMIQSDLLEYVH